MIQQNISSTIRLNLPLPWKRTRRERITSFAWSQCIHRALAVGLPLGSSTSSWAGRPRPVCPADVEGGFRLTASGTGRDLLASCPCKRQSFAVAPRRRTSPRGLRRSSRCRCPACTSRYEGQETLPEQACRQNDASVNLHNVLTGKKMQHFIEINWHRFHRKMLLQRK